MSSLQVVAVCIQYSYYFFVLYLSPLVGLNFFVLQLVWIQSGFLKVIGTVQIVEIISKMVENLLLENLQVLQDQL